MSDDQELAKALSGVSDQADGTPAEQQEEIVTTQVPPTQVPNSDDAASDDTTMPTPGMGDTTEPTVAVAAEEPAPLTAPVEPFPAPVAADGELDGIKKDAITELRPLVDKLNLEPNEKFDTYLLLLRSTDDKELVAPAHEAAKAIPDETKKAEALLEIIKEIDFLNQNQQ